MKNKKRTILSICVLAVGIGLLVVMCISLIPLLKQVLDNSGNEADLVPYISSYGIGGVFLLMGLQIFQVVLPFFPTAVIQILAGLCYGIWLGSLVCLIGCVLGNSLVFLGMRQFKKTFSELFAPNPNKKKKPNKFLSVATISRMPRPALIAFLLFLIPGIPNGILPYIFSQTKITYPRFILSVACASTPSILLCSILGERIYAQDYTTAIILGAVVVVLAVVFFLFRNKILARVERTRPAAPAADAAEQADPKDPPRPDV